MKRREFMQHLGMATGIVAVSPASFFESGLSGRPLFNEASALAQIEKLENEPAMRAAVRVERGGPRLFLHGEEVYPLLALSTHLYPTLDNFKQAGINMYQPILGMRSGWPGPDRYDWSKIDAFLGRLLELNPKAMFLPRIQLNTPSWWKRAHPDELVKYGLPAPERMYDIIRRKKLEPSEGGHYFKSGNELWEASYASEIWRQDTARMLQAFIEHIENSPLKSRVIGYHPTTGRTAEWNAFGPDYLPDYSEPMRRACGKIPDPQARLHTTFGLLRDPAKEKDVIDFYVHYHHTIAETVLIMARTIKEATKDRVLCGVFYGYVLEQVRIQEGGYLAAKIILESPYLDYIAGPYTYQSGNVKNAQGVAVNMQDGAGNILGNARGVGGDGGFRLLVESVRRHGKMYVSEMDPSTYRDKNPHRVIGGSGGPGSNTLAGSKLILQRDLGQVFASGVGGWLYDFGPINHAAHGWYSGRPLIQEIRRFVELGELRKTLDIGPIADIAAIYDVKSFAATQHWNAGRPWRNFGIRYTDFFNHWFLNTQARAFHRLGAPMDYLFHFDLQPADARRYRLLFVVNLFYLTDEEVSRLQTLLQDSGMTVVWFYAPGLIAPEKLDLARMQTLTGFEFKIINEPGPMLIRCDFEEDGERFDTRFGVDTNESPRFAVMPNNAEERSLGYWQDRDEVAFADKKYRGFRSVYLGSAPLPVEVLRWLVRSSSAPLWCSEPDIVYATRGAAMLVASKRGRRTLTLPTPMAPITGGMAQQKHVLDMDFGEVRLFIKK